MTGVTLRPIFGGYEPPGMYMAMEGLRLFDRARHDPITQLAIRTAQHRTDKQRRRKHASTASRRDRKRRGEDLSQTENCQQRHGHRLFAANW